MKWQIPAAALAAVVSLTVPASAQQDGPLRRFTDDDPGDTNRSNRIAYIPIGWKFNGPRPGKQPYDVASATWLRQTPGSPTARPATVRDKAEYRLERFETISGGAQPQLVATITRTPALPTDAPPLLQVIHAGSLISLRVQPTVESIAGGVRYTFQTVAPEAAVGTPGRTGRMAQNAYELRFLTADEVKLPDYIVRAPTFSGQDPVGRAMMPPPRLPQAERVAGKRIEYRSAQDPGRVVDRKVAGYREETRIK